MDKNYVYLADPSFGNIKVKKAKFQEMFYQRDDLKYPEKILVIVPNTALQKENILSSFMDILFYTSLVNNYIKLFLNYIVIKNEIVQYLFFQYLFEQD
jgi:uncharacterized protein